MDKKPIFDLASNTVNFFNNLAFVFGIKASQDGLLKIPAKTGTGIIRKFEIAHGIDLVFFDFYLKHKVLLKKMIPTPVEEKSLSVICVLTPAGLKIIRRGEINPEDDEDVPVVTFTSAANELDLIILPNHFIKAVIINFKIDSLERECPDESMDLYHGLKVLLHRKKHLHFKEQASISVYHKLNELLDHAIRNRADKVVVKSQTISMLLDIIKLILSKHQHEEDGATLLYSKMEMVKGLLAGYLESKLPPIPVIAKNMAVSESTLKRNFKHVFGTSIYDFYLQIKMEKARELFAEKPLSVKEVAYRLGYEKTSSFIRIFRKFYNFSPGELKRKVITESE